MIRATVRKGGLYAPLVDSLTLPLALPLSEGE